ncbi:hypothetical protein GJ689_24490 [Rhodoplanes serenus]|uniref:Bacteriophage Mu Gp45 N-terminal domain-containing protein n=1 Tax=Rhodoplanes serenus TaxID=200615 RepID=A0A9X5AVC2_9BRAD|nr:phage baseplate assembly protein [Rhodoplanes serenus]MTW19355.1 hypothetical protein [Rhodoplanes serenus]
MRDIVHMLRGLIARAVVRGSDDTKATQLVDVTVREGHDRTAVEVLQPFGLASRPPAGGLTIVLAVGGDQGDLVALPIGAPGARLGHLAEGEAALYGADGSRVHIKQDGSIEITAHKGVTVKTPHGEVTIAEDGIAVRRDDAALMVTDRIEGRVGASLVRVSVTSAKLVAGGHRMTVSAAGIVCSVMPRVAPDPDP